MNYGLADRVIVVTGGRAGIGAAIVAGLAAEGAVPVVLDRDATADFPLDLTDEAACGAAISTIAARYRRIDG